MKPDAGTRAPAAGTVAWLDRWVGQARPGARQEIGPLEAPESTPADLGRRVQELARHGLITAAWSRGPARAGGLWTWRLMRTHRLAPVGFPELPVLQRRP